MNEEEIKRIAKSGLKITIRDMLREISRSKTQFRFDRDERWEILERDLQSALFNQFGLGVCVAIDWESYLTVDPSINDKVLSPETLVPYLRCHNYCAEYLTALDASRPRGQRTRGQLL